MRFRYFLASALTVALTFTAAPAPGNESAADPDPRGHVTGTVTDEHGTSLAGASVEAYGIEPGGSEVTGTVRDPEGRPLAGIDVFAVDMSVEDQRPDWDNAPTTGTDGRFHFFVAPGTYRLMFRERNSTGDSTWPTQVYPAGMFVEEGKDVVVPEGSGTTNRTMTLQRAARITGRVHPEELGRWPLDGQSRPDVAAFRQVGGRWGWVDVWSRVLDATGRYRIPMLAPGRYIVAFGYSSTHEDGYVGDATRARARRIDVVGGQVVSGQDVTLRARGIIRGTVRDSRGRPVEGAVVSWVSPMGGWTGYHYYTGERTDASGRYAILGRRPGFYRVGVRVGGRQTAYWPRLTRPTNAVDLGIDRWETRRGVDFTVDVPTGAGARRAAPPVDPVSSRTDPQPVGDMVGRAIAPTGQDIQCVTVVAYRREGGRWVWAGRGVSTLVSGLAARWRIPGLPAGRYRLRAVDDGWHFFGTEWYGGARNPRDSTVVDFRPARDSDVTKWRFRLDPQVRAFGVPRVSGRMRVGSQLRAVTGLWSPDDTVLTYRWLRDGRLIAGATSRTYRVTPADRGSLVTVRVTGQRVSLLPRVVASRPTARVR